MGNCILGFKARIIISKFGKFLMNTECLHSKDQENVTKSLQGRKIYKDQCVRCFHEPVNYVLFRLNKAAYLYA